MVRGTLVTVILALSVAGASLTLIDRSIYIAQTAAQVHQIPPVEPAAPTALRVASLGWRRAAADAVWLTTIQYFGGGDPNERYDSLAALIRTVVTVDPDFEYPYLFGGIVLPWQSDNAAALALLDDGQARFPQNALMPYYAGAIARLQLKDDARAAAYFQRAASLPDAPPAAALLAGLSLNNSDDREVALAWWTSVAESSTNSLVHDRAVAWRDQLSAELALERLAKQEATAGRPIKSISDLVTRGLVSQLPASPLGLSWHWNPTSQTVFAN